MADSAIRRALLDAVSAHVASQGVEELSLRTVTAAVGKSTTAVFQAFGGKDGLLRASIEDALEQDRAFHEDFLSAMQGAPQTRAVAAELVCLYVLRRARARQARLWLEALYKASQFPDLSDLFQAWTDLRRGVWEGLLADGPFAPLAPLLASYTAAEEAYAAALCERPPYLLLLRETALRLFDGALGEQDQARPRSPVGPWVEQQVAPLPQAAGPMSPGMERLLQAAVRNVVQDGAAGLNLRKVAADAQVSPSQIIYHFGSFAGLRSKAIWSALMGAIPRYFEQASEAPAGPREDWDAQLEAMAAGGGPGRESGYYVSYARILGQACLSASREGELQPLILHLRAIEGVGIHRVSGRDWPEPLRLGRDNAAGFAIWIKGQAVLNQAAGCDGAACEAAGRVRMAAAVLSGPADALASTDGRARARLKQA